MRAGSHIPWVFLLVVGLGIALVAWFRTLPGGEPARPSDRGAPLEEAAPAAEPAIPLTDAKDPLARTPAATSAAADPTPSTNPAAAGSACTITGRCVEAGGRPIAGASIRILWVHSPSPGRGDRPWVEGSTREDGRFQLAFEPGSAIPAPASVAIMAKHDGFAGTRVKVPASEPARFDAGDVVLERGVTLTGTVRDTSGVPQSGVTIRVWRTSGSNELDYNPDDFPAREDGTFVFADAPAGPIRISALADDGRRSEDVLADLQPGMRKDGIELVLPLYLDPSAISGIVVDPDGKPVADAPVRVEAQSPEGSSISPRTTDERGRFRARGRPGSVFALRARDEDDAIGSAAMDGIPAGTHGIRLVLKPPRAVTLRVVDAHGNPVESFGWLVIEETPMSARTMHTEAEAARPGGTATLRADADPISVQVDARGFESLKLGPFAASALGETLEARLHRMPVVRGIVTENGAPVPGAAITLLDPVPANESFVENGFDQRFQRCRDCPKATTDAEGRFELAPSKHGLVAVRAAKTGRPVAIGAAIDLQPDQPDVQLSIEIPSSGAIAGAVRHADGRPEKDWTIFASCGDGELLEKRTDEHGRFRFEALAPGGWQVRARRAGVDRLPGDSEQTTWTHTLAPPIEWDCQVRPDETCVRDFVISDPCDLVLRLEEPFRSGTFEASASITCTGFEFEEQQHHELTAAGGVWSGTLPCAGKARVAIEGTLDGMRWGCTRDVQLAAGSNEVVLRVATCALVGRVPASQTESAHLWLSWHRGEEGTGGSISFEPGPEGRFSIPRAPAGACTLNVRVGKNVRSRDFDLPAGGNVDVGEL